ncbi:putative spore germination protein [Brevibacillus brevis NBRC 100599]|uniref:Putative spore germination protein n=1 Tax=Brevibacillus brevis (strain 47 / JCM 6285 / NBRC 100599) TaxID=358681 RepID=C0ZIP8_BREBN|nr:spore germination protein [Brevibacillus brevis]BAH41266.1 putative spore germination protein [Brevibacillus brevis NBRC 100599]
MLPTRNDRITTSQTAVIIINFILGAGILTLPRISVEKAKTPDVWISVIIGGLLAMLAGIIIVKLSQRFPEKTFFEYSQEIAGEWVGRMLSLLIICYFCMTSSLQVRSMAEVTTFYLLEKTPMWAIVMVFLWVALYLVIGGINCLARMLEIILPITVLFFLVVSLMSIKIFEIDHLRPVLGLGWKPVFDGIKPTALAYTGFEIMMIIVVYMRQPNKGVKAVVVGISASLIFYLMTVVMVIGAFSIDGVVTRTWPTIDLIRSFEITGLLFERFESLLLVLWIMQIFSTFTLAYYSAALGLAQLFKKNMEPFLFGLLPVIYIITMTPKEINSVFALGDFVGDAAFFLFGVMPLLLLIISGWKVGKHEAKSSS